MDAVKYRILSLLILRLKTQGYNKQPTYPYNYSSEFSSVVFM